MILNKSLMLPLAAALALSSSAAFAAANSDFLNVNIKSEQNHSLTATGTNAQGITIVQYGCSGSTCNTMLFEPEHPQVDDWASVTVGNKDSSPICTIYWYINSEYQITYGMSPCKYGWSASSQTENNTDTITLKQTK